MKYWAFISYSSKDRSIAEWLHKRLENFAVPKKFGHLELAPGEPLKKRLRPIFRDRDELSSSSELGPAIEHALEQSKFLIVICSPHSATSEWVEKEIQFYRKLGKEKQVLAIITDGEPNASQPGLNNHAEECFPPSLRLPFEPLAADIRKEGDGKVRGPIKLLAGILETDFDELYRRHRRLKLRQRLALSVALFTMGLVVSFLIIDNREKERIAQASAIVAADARASEDEQRKFAKDAQASEVRQRVLNANLKSNLSKSGMKMTPFIEAIIDGDVAPIQKALNSGQDIEEQFGGSGYTPLMIATIAGSAKSLNFLLDQGANYLTHASAGIKTRGATALHVAAAANQKIPLGVFRERGLSLKLRTRNAELMRAIDIAAVEGNVEIIKFLHSSGLPIEVKGKFLTSDDIELIRRVEGEMNGVKNSVFDTMESTKSALFWAAFFGREDAVKLLLELGADPKMVIRKDGSTVFQAIMESGQIRTADLLSDHIGEFSTEELTRQLLAVTTLSKIVQQGDTRISRMRTLIEKGADVNLPVNRGKNWSKYKGGVLEQHLRGGGLTTGKDYIPALKILLEAGASPNPKHLGWDVAPLRIAVRDAERRDTSLQAMELLIKHGADLEEKGKYGDTVLMEACDRGSKADAVRILLKSGAKTSYILQRKNRRPERKDALLEARQSKNHEAVLLLEKHLKDN